MIKLGVIVSSYNRPMFLKEALDSIANQTIAKEISVVVVDDGSVPEVLDVANTFSGITDGKVEKASKFGAFRIIQSIPVQHESERTKTNRVAIGVNQGLRYMWNLPSDERPSYLSYLGDDDLYFPSRCEKMVNFLDNNPQIFLAYHFMEIYQCDLVGNLTVKLLDLHEIWDEPTEFWVRYIYNRIDHISFVHRISPNYLWDEDEAFRRASDWGFLLRALMLDEKFMHIPEYLAQGRKIKGDSINLEGNADVRTQLGKKSQKKKEKMANV
jgi:glycosyltransferase involved in cell wall biosynthesis